MWLSGQEFTPAVVAWIAAAVEAEPSLSLRRLSRQVCEFLGWEGPLGKPAEANCRKALLALERQGVLSLPARVQPHTLQRGCTGAIEPPEVAFFVSSLGELGPVEVVPVSSRWCADSEIWKGLMQAYHYLGAGRPVGPSLRYLVRSESHGLLGGVSFSAAARRLEARDKWIGWSERARRANLPKVVCNNRFLIVPSVQVLNLASHVLSLVLKRLAADWRERYGYQPVLVETFVDAERYAGTCYRAANWQPVGKTAGRRRAFANGQLSTGKKEVLVYPLRSDCREQLCEEPAERLTARAPAGGTWVEEELGGARLYDGNLRRRLYRIAEDFFAQPLASIPQACDGSEAKVRAAYRFFRNTRVDMRTLLRGHAETTAYRVKQHKVVLAVQDTTTLSYTTHPETDGLGPINTTRDGAIGLIVHDTVAFTAEGVPLGIIDAQVWAREAVDVDKTRKRKERPIKEKESVKWLRSYEAVSEVQRLCPDTIIVSCGDRESDIHELFELAGRTQGGAQLLVRADKGRRRRVEGESPAEHESLWERMQRTPLAGTVDVKVPRKGSRPARLARLEIRFERVVLEPPKDKKLSPVEVWAVYALETDPPEHVREPLEWMLLTTVEVASFEQATERLEWYTQRWSIEVFHRVLKSGCRIEDRQLRTAQELESCLAIDMVVAWRVFWLTKQGRETPDIPCDVFLEEHEWKALCAVVRKQPPPDNPPSLREAVRMIAKLGGFLGRKCDREPGTTTIWRGLTRLEGIAIGFQAALALMRSRDGP